MGAGASDLTRQDLEDYEALTYFTRKEIIHVHKRFLELCDKAKGQARSSRAKVNAKTTRLQFSTVCECLPELKVNPFRYRLCRIFSSDPNGEDYLIFEDFLDMMSVLCDNCDRKVKIEYAFRMFDYDEDDMIGESDVREVILALTGGNTAGQQRFTSADLDILVDNIMAEADLDGDKFLSYAEFEHVISKSPDFIKSFRIKL